MALNVCYNDLNRFVEDLTDGQGADACIEGAWESCIRCVRNFGTVMSLGNPKGEMRLSQDGYWKILRKEINIVGTWNSSFGQRYNDWKQALWGMHEKKLDLLPLITQRFPLEQYQEAFRLMHERREMYCKVMLVNE